MVTLGYSHALMFVNLNIFWVGTPMYSQCFESCLSWAGIYLKSQDNTFTRRWLRSGSSLDTIRSVRSWDTIKWGSGMIHVRDARKFEEREILIEVAEDRLWSPLTLNYSVLLDYKDVTSLIFLDALPHTWKVDDTKTTLTNTRVESNETIVIAWFHERHSEILCAAISPSRVELYAKATMPPVDIRKELNYLPASEVAWTDAGFSKLEEGKSRIQAYLEVKRIFDNVIFSLRFEWISAKRKHDLVDQRDLFLMTNKEPRMSD